MMSAIRFPNSLPELALGRALDRFGPNPRDLLAQADLVPPCHRAAGFVHACFWNSARDREDTAWLDEDGWGVATLSELGLKVDRGAVIDDVGECLTTTVSRFEAGPGPLRRERTARSLP